MSTDSSFFVSYCLQHGIIVLDHRSNRVYVAVSFNCFLVVFEIEVSRVAIAINENVVEDRN